MTSNRTDIIYPIIVLASIMLIVWQHFGMNKSLDIYPSVNNPPTIMSDNVNGGRSSGSIKIINGVLNFNCHTVQSDHTFAFCGVVLPLNSNSEGVDLSGYSQLDIWFELEAENTDTVLIYLRNKEISADEILMLRSNLRPLLPKSGMEHYTLKLDEFSVPSWWLFANQGAKGDGETDFTNIVDLFITTGDNPLVRIETIKIKHVEMKGKWLSTEKTYLIILITWATLAFIHLLRSLLRLSKNLENSKTKTESLESMNKLLCIENNKFESMAKSDPLTKALNRAGCRDVLDQVVGQLNHCKIPCSLIMFDIDHFKPVNDQYGHDVGDQLLVNLVAYIKQNIRDQDSLVRWGGEEFVLICQNTVLKDAVRLAEKFRVGIAESRLLTPKITCSFGVSEIQSSAVSIYFKKADVALYKAKKQGRNKVVSANDS